MNSFKTTELFSNALHAVVALPFGLALLMGAMQLIILAGEGAAKYLRA